MIPHHIIQFWDNPNRIPPHIQSAIDQWKHLQSWKHTCFDDRTAKELIEEHFDSNAMRAYEACAHPVLRSDLFRYAALYKFGGMYVDADEVWTKDPTAFISQSPGLSFIQAPVNPDQTNNCVIICAAEHPIMRRILYEAISNILGKLCNNITDVSGPSMISRVLKSVNHSGVNIIPQVEFKCYFRSVGLTGAKTEHWSNFQMRNSIFKEPIQQNAPGILDLIESIPVPISDSERFLDVGRQSFDELKKILLQSNLFLRQFHRAWVVEAPGFPMSRWFYFVQEHIDVRIVTIDDQPIVLPELLKMRLHNLASLHPTEHFDRDTPGPRKEFVVIASEAPKIAVEQVQALRKVWVATTANAHLNAGLEPLLHNRRFTELGRTRLYPPC